MPSRTELDEAILAPPKLRLVPQYLHDGTPETITVAGVPTPWAKSGTFAVVYKFRLRSGQPKAIRCFYKEEVPLKMQRRYERLHALLPRHAPAFTVGFQYEPQGIKARGEDNKLRTYPIVVMDWVEGEDLLKEIGRLAKAKDTDKLRELARKWVDLIFAMKKIQMAHGDLSGGNVMVRPNGELVLVDYDGLYLPDPELEQCVPEEFGEPDYQHPNRQQRPYNEHMDDFSALVIYLAILALCERPALFQKYVKHNALYIFWPTEGFGFFGRPLPT